MKKLILELYIVSFIVAIFYGCNIKSNVEPENTISSTEQTKSKAQNEDSKNFGDYLKDATDNLNSGFGSAGRLDASEAQCGLKIDYSQFKANKTITYTFDGTSCNGIVRSGKAIVKLVNGQKFEDQNATWTIKFEAYSAVINGKKINMDADFTCKNVTGGSAWGVILGPWITALGVNYKPIVKEKLTGIAFLKLDTTALTRTWNINRLATVSRVDSDWTISLDGDTSINGYNKVIEWGETRFGDTFYKEMQSPLAINSKCDWWRPTSGKCKHTVIKPSNKKYFINSEFLFDAKGCGNAFKLDVSDENNNSWNATLYY
jgi:hypothetical protein